MTLYDVLNNWIQLKLVADHRPEDEAARVSVEHVEEILDQDYQVQIRSVSKKENTYEVVYVKDAVENKQSFPARTAEVLLEFINDNPERYEFK